MPEIQDHSVCRIRVTTFNEDGSPLGDMAAIETAIKFAEDFYSGEWAASKTKPPYAHNLAVNDGPERAQR